jgi:hypothetical protein
MTEDAHMNRTLDGAHNTRHSSARASRSSGSSQPQQQQAAALNTSASGPSVHAYSTRTAQRLWANDADESMLDLSSAGNNTTVHMASSR